jgi:hypothetical protein
LDFQAIPPYGPFEKAKNSALSSLSSKEPFFKTYDDMDTEIQHTTYFDKSQVETGRPQAKASGSVFMYIDRVRLVQSIIIDTIDFSELMSEGILLKHYSTHREEQLENLQTTWASMRTLFQRQDLAKIRKYFGEKIALYFAWLEMYVVWLIIPAFFGACCFGVIIGTDDLNDTEPEMSSSEIVVILYALLLSIGATFFD